MKMTELRIWLHLLLPQTTPLLLQTALNQAHLLEVTPHHHGASVVSGFMPPH